MQALRCFFSPRFAVRLTIRAGLAQSASAPRLLAAPKIVRGDSDFLIWEGDLASVAP